jgi:hypothetical protein
MPGNSEPIYYQILSGQDPPLTALSAPPGPNPGGDLVNATPDDQSDRQQWELVVSLAPNASEFRVALRNKHTGFVAAAPVGDNTWGVTQEGGGPLGSLGSTALLWTFVPAGDSDPRWAIRPAGRPNQNLSAMSGEIGSEVGIRGVDSGHPSEAWWAIADFDDPEGRH